MSDSYEQKLQNQTLDAARDMEQNVETLQQTVATVLQPATAAIASAAITVNTLKSSAQRQSEAYKSLESEMRKAQTQT